MSQIGEQLVDLNLPVQGLVINSDALKWAVLKIPAGRLLQVDTAFLSAPIAVAAVDTNYNTVYLRNNSATAAAIMEFANGPAQTGLAVALAGTEFAESTTFETNRYVGSDSAETILYVTSTKTGNGLALPDLTLHLRGKWIK